MTATADHSQRLRALFAGLKPAIAVATEAQVRLDRVAATRFSVFEYFKENENLISGIFADLLRPDGTHGQGTTFLKAFLAEIDRGNKGDIRKRSEYEHLEKARVYTEYPTSQNRRIDIVIRIGERWIGVENKPWAGEQHEQLQHYLDFLRGWDKNACVLYLSGSGEDPETIKDTKRCLTIPYGYAGDGPSVAHWVTECQRLCQSDKVRWFLSDMDNYVQRMFYASVSSDEQD